MKLRYLCPLCSLPVVAVTTIPFVSSCSSFSSKLYSCASGQTFNSQRSTNDFDKYISDKGKPLNYSAGSSTDTKMCSKIASLLKPSDMIFLMAYDVSNMFNDDDENIAANLSNVVLYVDKQKDNTFNIAEYWTDKSYEVPDSTANGANAVAHCINDTRIAVTSVSVNTQKLVWEIVFSPVMDNAKLSIDRFSFDGEHSSSTMGEQLNFTFTLGSYAAEKLFPGWEMPIVIS